MKRILTLAVALGVTISSAQEAALSLDAPAIDKADGLTLTPSKRKLGYEGTPLAPKASETAPKKAKGQTEITAQEEATFDQKSHEAVFIGDVVVKDPEFTVVCDRLTAYLKKQDEKKAASPAPAANPEAKSGNKGGALERAVAEANAGNIVTITQDKVEADGNVSRSIGKGQKVTYNAATGDIVLTGNPSVQQGINLCLATSASTVMTLNRNGRMKVVGPHKTVIKDTASVDSAR